MAFITYMQSVKIANAVRQHAEQWKAKYPAWRQILSLEGDELRSYIRQRGLSNKKDALNHLYEQAQAAQKAYHYTQQGYDSLCISKLHTGGTA